MTQRLICNMIAENSFKEQINLVLGRKRERQFMHAHSLSMIAVHVYVIYLPSGLDCGSKLGCD